MLPFKDYAILALIAIAVFVAWDWQHQIKARAAETATYKANAQTFHEVIEAAHDANTRLARERTDGEQAMALAQRTAAATQARHDSNVAALAELERSTPAVRTYLDGRMPDALFNQLRQSSDRDPGNGAHRAAPGVLNGAVAAARSSRPVHTRPGERVAPDTTATR